MNIRNIGPYTLITGMPYKNGELRQLYKKNSVEMIQLYIDNKIIKKSVIDTHQMKTVFESIKDKGSNIVKVIKDLRNARG